MQTKAYNMSCLTTFFKEPTYDHNRSHRPYRSPQTRHPARPRAQHHHPHLCPDERPVQNPGESEGRTCQGSGCGISIRATCSASTGTTQPKSLGRRLWRRQLPRAASRFDGCPGAHRRHRRQVVPDRCAQGGGGVFLPRAAAGHRSVRPDHAEGGLAFDRQLLPRRGL